MKTVIDAVNEFKGVWPYYEANNMILCIDSYSMYIKGCFESYTCDEFSGLNKINWVAACSKSEFNQCIAEMSEGSFVPKASKNMIKALEHKAGDKALLVENTNLFSCYYDEVYELKANDIVTIVGFGIRPDNGAPLVTITNGKGFATLNPDYIAPPVKLVDGQAYQFTIREQKDIITGIYCNEMDTFDISQGQYFDAIACTNIIPLVPAT